MDVEFLVLPTVGTRFQGTFWRLQAARRGRVLVVLDLTFRSIRFLKELLHNKKQALHVSDENLHVSDENVHVSDSRALGGPLGGPWSLEPGSIANPIWGPGKVPRKTFGVDRSRGTF